jgi:hypothetical protein
MSPVPEVGLENMNARATGSVVSLPAAPSNVVRSRWFAIQVGVKPFSVR